MARSVLWGEDGFELLFCASKVVTIHLVLTLASCDADDIINDTAAFVRSRYSKWVQHNSFGYVIP